ncbi:element excision factor XisI family protein [Chroococcidiopsis sp. CCMEE 29]|uniref:element excision factor XisI family protein n=1 Tax=Chroococcidiopsis sp. CCMEE 29 TaxID=155894 RepID=UPI0031F8D321
MRPRPPLRLHRRRTRRPHQLCPPPSSVGRNFTSAIFVYDINNTELDIGQDLVERGIPKENIVIGFQPPYFHQYSGYAAV